MFYAVAALAAAGALWAVDRLWLALRSAANQEALSVCCWCESSPCVCDTWLAR